LIASFEKGRMLRDGAVVAIVGRTNVGKSSLLNALLGEEKAIVTSVGGPTRDLIEEVVSLSGMLLRVVDTAGIRKWRNMAEKEGIRRTKRMIADAALVLVVVDRSRPLGREDRETSKLVEGKRAVVVLNKMDLSERVKPEQVERVFPGRPVVEISARTGEGMETLKERIERTLSGMGLGEVGEQTVIIEARHRRALEEAQEAIGRARAATGCGWSQEIVALEIRCAVGKLGEIVGETVAEDVLEAIFERFCVGK
jgi:tRNA modification GTPase